MKIVNTSVKRPVGVIMIVLAIVALGIVSARSLVLDLFPKIDLPVAVVATNYEDAAPQEVEKLISQPLESSVSSVEGINTIQSQSQSGSSLVLMMFNNGVDLDQALLDVRERVDQVKGMLPETAGDPNIMRFSPDQVPVVWLSLTGKDAATLTELADNQLVPFFERQEGVASVTIEGAKEREIQVLLDPVKLQQYGINDQIVMQALNSQNKSASVGSVEKGNKDLQIRVVGEYESLDDIKETLIQTPEGRTLHVEDIATVKDTYKEQTSETLVNGEPGVVLSMMKKTDANTVEVADNILEGMEDLNENLPKDVALDVVIDTSEFIKLSIDSVVKNILIGGVISIFVLLLFLRSIRATIVIGLSIPIAIISTFALMYFTGQSLNILTLGGLALGLGMMVDSSIVILENIYSYRQRGYSLFESATKGASELAPAVIASTTTTLVVFLPIVYVEGIASDLFTPLALTVSFSLIASLVVAVTLVPMLSSKLLANAMEDHGRRYWFNRFLERLNQWYANTLKRVLKYRKTTVFVTILAIIGSLALTPFIGAEFIPQADEGQMEIRVETAPGSSLAHTQDVADKVHEKLDQYEEAIETNYVSIGSNTMPMAGSSGNTASFMIQLVPASERTETTTEIVKELDEDVKDIVGASIQVSESQGDMSMGDPIAIQVNGPEHDVLRELSEDIVQEIAQIKGVYNPESAASDAVPQMHLTVDKEKAAHFGLSQEDVLEQVQTQFTGQIATKYREDGQEMDVSLLYPENKRSSIHDLQDMKIANQEGTMMPLESLVEFNEMQSPAALLRENQQPQMNISSGIIDRDLGSIVQDVEATLSDMEKGFPEGYSYSIGGQAEDMAKSFSDLALALIFSIFLVYAVMAIQFENFLFPFIIMFSMPTMIVGVFVGLFIVDIPLSIPGFIGIIMLAGIVVNNSIVLVDYINILRRRGIDRFEAIIQAGKSRLRPILMTTLTTILGMVPVGLALGEGAEMQQPLAITIIFGLTVSSIFTLLLIPVVYTYFDDLTAKLTRRNKKKKEA